MKVSIITIIDNTNFGTYLQALATGKVIERLGYEVEIINYIRPSLTGYGQIKSILYDRGVLSLLFNFWKIPAALNLRGLDYVFLTRYMHATKEYVGYQSLQSDPPLSDIYVVGSDQVWNSIYNRGIDKSFYLEFAPQGKKRVAFASSIGMDSFSPKECDEIISLLQKFNHITVREESAKVLLEKMGIKSEVVLDPTLLLNSNEWLEFSDKTQVFCDEKYLLIYSVELKKQNRLIEFYARKIANKLNLKIFQISYGGPSTRFSCTDRFWGRATPDLFLSLMKHASFVVVSSFHGTAFAVNFRKEFLTISANRFNSRVNNLLSITNLTSRLISDYDYDVESIMNIDYHTVNTIIEEERKKTIDRLMNHLKY